MRRRVAKSPSVRPSGQRWPDVILDDCLRDARPPPGLLVNVAGDGVGGGGEARLGVKIFLAPGSCATSRRDPLAFLILRAKPSRDAIRIPVNAIGHRQLKITAHTRVFSRNIYSVVRRCESPTAGFVPLRAFTFVHRSGRV